MGKRPYVSWLLLRKQIEMEKIRSAKRMAKIETKIDILMQKWRTELIGVHEVNVNNDIEKRPYAYDYETYWYLKD